MNKLIKVLIGSVFMLSGIILSGFTLLTAVTYMPQLQGWSSPPGKFMTGLSNCGATFPFVLSILLTALGMILLCKEYLDIYKNQDKREVGK